MAEDRPRRRDLFDEEPEKQAEPLQKEAEAPGQEEGGARVPRAMLAGVGRRRFLTGAGLAAAGVGAAIGVGATLGVDALSGGKEEESARGVLGVPTGVEVADAVVSLNINGKDHRIEVRANESLAEVLRQRLGLIGTKISCDRSECSACTVLVDGMPANSCSLLAIREDGKKIVTIEGLDKDGKLHPVQEAFISNMGLQCGFCTPGLIVQTVGLLARTPNPTDADIRRAMSGNLCKCSAYPNILAAIQSAAKSVPV